MRLNTLIELLILSIFTFILSAQTYLLTDFSKPYSTSIAHRLQTNAFLKGHLSLSPLPFGYQLDFNWTGHGLQQTWGLGVPLLRLPFEWVASALGLGTFSDRLVILFYLAIAIFLLNVSIKFLLTSFGLMSNNIMSIFVRWYLIAWAFFSPAIGGLVQHRIDVYHETIFYGCLYVYFLLSLFWIYITKSNDQLFLFLCLLSGLGCLIRPTLFFYGFTTISIASLWAFKNKRHIGLISIGISCFTLGLIIDLWCNYIRFGSIFNFGYSENFCGVTIINYGMRFDYPFHQEPFLSAARELIGKLFFNNLWQSPTVRWRNSLDFPLFNVSNLILSGIGFICFMYLSLSQLLTHSKNTKLPDVYLRAIYPSLAWGLTCSILLFIFYLRLPFLNARYISEFSPAFFAIFVALFLMALFNLTIHIKNKNIFISISLLMGLLFYISNGKFFIFDIKSFRQHAQSQITDKSGVDRLVSQFNHDAMQRPHLLETTYCGQSYQNSGAMFQQYDGWKIHTNCLVSALTSAILPVKPCLTLNYQLLTIPPLPKVQIKRDLTFLHLTYSQMTQMTVKNSPQIRMTQIYCTDEPAANPVALYSIGWLTPKELNKVRNKTIPVKLNWISVTEKYLNNAKLKR